jgi:hypothetical protein
MESTIIPPGQAAFVGKESANYTKLTWASDESGGWIRKEVRLQLYAYDTRFIKYFGDSSYPCR